MFTNYFVYLRSISPPCQRLGAEFWAAIFEQFNPTMRL